MNRLVNNIIKCFLLISFPLFLFSCQGAVKSYQIANTLESKGDNYKQAIYKSYLWLDRHAASFEEGGALPILEEIIAFYVLMHNTEDRPQKNNYFHQIQKRINVIALNKDYTVKQKEYTVFLTVATIAEKLGIHTVDFKKIIEEQLIPSPLLYTENITSTVSSITISSTKNRFSNMSNLVRHAESMSSYRTRTDPDQQNIVGVLALRDPNLINLSDQVSI